ncbi:MAG: 5'-nucleotidase C-terminal domain-containing protein [Terriglobia bacterium]|jgi:2',3'-cyclic-nucleotide 2'-phosphodiesterase (5'-nucleotidase family)|nr:5'-nucleotidase C-terminal domain-containing protein [Terriglobia bacterium]
MRNHQRRFIAQLITAALVALALCLTVVPPVAAQSAQITLLHINDTHSHLDAWGPKDANLDGTLGGLPKAAAIINAEKTADLQALFVYGGDFMEGDLFFRDYLGVPELSLLRSLGLDVMVLGNHDFVAGPDFPASVFQSAWPTGGVPVVGTNLVVPTNSPLYPWVTPWVMKEVNGVKVGIIGITVRNAPRENNAPLGHPAPVTVLKYTVDPVPGTVAALRSAGAQVIICIAHIGMVSARDLATKVPDIDVIVNGHDHAVLEQPEKVGKTLIISAGDHYRYVGRLRLAVAGSQVSLVDYALLSVDETVTPLASVQAEIDNLKAGIVARYGDVYHQRLAVADPDLTAQFNPNKAKRDTALGNLYTDAYRGWTGTDVAIEATGWLGDDFPAGPIVGADVFRGMSYAEPALGKSTATPWRLVTFRTSGATLLAVLEATIALGGDYFPQVSGMRLDYDSSASAGSKILADTVHLGGKILAPDQFYSVTVTEGTYGALLSLKVPMQDVQLVPVSAFDATRLLVASRGTLGLATSNRIRDVAGKFKNDE